MKTTLVLISVIHLFAQTIFGQEELQRNYPNHLQHEPKNPCKFVEPFTSKNQMFISRNVLFEDFIVNDDTTIMDNFFHEYPTIATDSLGNFVIAWEDWRNVGPEIYFQRYNLVGVAQGINTRVNQISNSSRPSIAMAGNGSFVISWEDDRNYSDIYFQRYNSNGVAQGTNTKVNDDVGNEIHGVPSIAMDGSGCFVIAWNDNRNGSHDIYFQRYNSAGVKKGINTKVNDDLGSGWQNNPSIAVDRSGNFVITWEDLRNAYDYDLYYQRYDSNGVAQGINTKINDDVGHAYQWLSTIAMDGIGNFVIAWEDYRNGGTLYNSDIYYQRYNSSGTAQGTNKKVNEEIGVSNQSYPSIALDGAGNFVIVWEDYRNGGNNPDIIGQRYFANGNPNGNNYSIVVDGPNSKERFPFVAANNYTIIFSWMDNKRSGFWYDIRAKKVTWDWNGVTSVNEIDNYKPKEFSLSQNYPNPFNPSTRIQYQVSSNSYITLKIYDILGNEVATLVNEYKPAGSYGIEFSARGGQAVSSSNSEGVPSGLASGIYLYQLKAGEFVETKKMILLR